MTARNTADPHNAKLPIGICPDQWGVWFPEDDKQMAPCQAMLADCGLGEK